MKNIILKKVYKGFIKLNFKYLFLYFYILKYKYCNKI